MGATKIKKGKLRKKKRTGRKMRTKRTVEERVTDYYALLPAKHGAPLTIPCVVFLLFSSSKIEHCAGKEFRPQNGVPEGFLGFLSDSQSELRGSSSWVFRVCHGLMWLKPEKKLGKTQ